MSESTHEPAAAAAAAAGSQEPFGNLLIRDDPPSRKAQDSSPVYDARARNRFDFTLHRGSDSYELGILFDPLTDERYMQWNHELKVRGDQDEIEESSREATAALWDDLVPEVEGIEYPANADWKALFPTSAKVESVNNLLAVAIVTDEGQKGKKLVLGASQPTQTITTECWFNGEIARQSHVMAARTIELEKKYARIESKKVRQEKIGGLNKRKAKIEYVPQDEAKGELYDEMQISAKGFAGDVIPLRFKTIVVDFIFAPTLSPKTMGK